MNSKVSVLVVEDEPAVLSLAATTLRRQGYTVLEASDGEEAWEMVSKQAKDIDLLLTDVVMPRMGGIELQIRIETDFPELRVLFTSGYADEAVALSVGSERGLPFRASAVAELPAHLGRLLGRPGGSFRRQLAIRRGSNSMTAYEGTADVIYSCAALRRGGR